MRISDADGWRNLEKYYRKADTIDLDEGMVAYERYNMVMQRIAKEYGFALDVVCAVFCSLSPNSDYFGNLRSTVSVLDGVRHGKTAPDIVVSTYGHCKQRAIWYARGTSVFTNETKGPKILNFYHNILTPRSQQWVTIDGHMVGIWRDDPKSTMKENLISKREYDQIAYMVKEFAFRNFILPQQMQAILWFVRKRLSRVVYDPQLDLFAAAGDAWKTARDIEDIKPYTKRDVPNIMEKIDARQLEIEL